MIASLNGILSHKSTDHAVVDVAGVGYRVVISLNSFSRLPALNEKVFLWIHTAVREDDISLFGFVDEQERKVFQKLILVNGIGPRLALTILSGIGPRDLVDALHREDLARLTSISGIGKKTAERMILDLKDKLLGLLGEPLSSSSAGGGGFGGRVYDEALSALLNLGYTRPTAEKTLAGIKIGVDVPLEAVVRRALQSLSEVRR